MTMLATRSVFRLLPLTAVVLLATACRPSKKDFAQMQATLAQVQADQAALAQRIDAQSGSGDRGEAERAMLIEGLTDVARRLTEVEDKLTEQKEQVAAPRPGRPDPKAVYRVMIGDAPVKGSADALVTIVMWTDYQCPYCNRVQATLTQLEEHYGKDLRLVHKNNPLGFHPRAMPAAIAAAAAGRQGKFWEMNDLLFANQKQLTDKNFRKWAKKLKLNMGKFKEDLKDPELKRRIEAEQAQGIKIGARGTPAFFVNGRFLSGAQPFNAFQALIDEEKEKAQAMVREGLPPSKVYDVAIADGKTSV